MKTVQNAVLLNATLKCGVLEQKKSYPRWTCSQQPCAVLFQTQCLLLAPNRYYVGNSVVVLVFINDNVFQELGHRVRTREVLVPYLWVLLALMDARILSRMDHFNMVQIPTFTIPSILGCKCSYSKKFLFPKLQNAVSSRIMVGFFSEKKWARLLLEYFTAVKSQN